ncbi:radical SAM protein [Acuticoccus sp. I52.16.1]|uniref:radical SAM protein n=1 Tax=Acuticoccus sp. I52.16.1 TaxID=2928472 RepID=UPI001FD0557B|nr:radical SAM protein [Acuticoccus sp. I52.16.1]UOM36135.1 B12-binding domain-containing radical SAM protein [Acuticoccus sp. I52.16.1]
MSDHAVSPMLGSGSFVPRTRRTPRTTPSVHSLRIALVCPRFEPSFYGDDYYVPIASTRARATMAPGVLPLLAALVDRRHDIALFDENTDPLDFEHLRSFDIVGVTGMIVQRIRLREILDELADYPGILAVGGPYASIDEDFFSRRCDVVFVGEADESWPRFVDDVAHGRPFVPRIEQAAKTDMSKLPQPRYDLVDHRKYLSASVQFSRGCPFMCEFCDIITIYGRKPRAKDPGEVIAELETLRRRGVRTVFLVDDNLIGNKKLARGLLVELVAWQKANNYPLKLATEVSINLADEPDLLELMYEAGMSSIFIGIESPSEASLAETKKVQNIRGDSMADKLARVRDAGLIVTGGMIVGFDSDGPDIFQMQEEFVQEVALARAGIATLTVLPTTPLFTRMQMEGRLRLDNPNCNFEPLQMSAEELSAGVASLNQRLFEPEAYFDRYFRTMAMSPTLRDKRMAMADRRGKPPLSHRALAYVGAVAQLWRLARAARAAGEAGNILPRYAKIFRKRRTYRFGTDATFPVFVNACAQHWHLYYLYKSFRADKHSITNTYAYSTDIPVAAPTALAS